MGPIGTAALGLGVGAVENASDLVFGQFRQDQQLKGQKKALAQQNAAALDMWNKTNYGAQMGHLKSAGLNPGLIYGMGGAGGQLGSSNAMPEAAKAGTMDIAGNAQLALMQAQKENIEADTKNKEAEAAATAGVRTEKIRTEIDSIRQDIKNQVAEEALTDAETVLRRIDARYQGETVEARIASVDTQLNKLQNELRIIENNADISNATKDTAIQAIKVDLLQKLLDLEATKQGISESKSRQGLMSTQGKKLLADIVQGYISLEEAGKRRNVDEDKVNLEKQKFELHKFTGIPMDIINSVIGFGVVKQILNPGRTVIEGFKR